MAEGAETMSSVALCDVAARDGLQNPARGSRRGSTSALIGVAQWLEAALGRQFEGQVYRAGPLRPPAG
jgi:hypothetical protein